jgi:hypothetical protein
VKYVFHPQLFFEAWQRPERTSSPLNAPERVGNFVTSQHDFIQGPPFEHLLPSFMTPQFIASI